MSELEKLYIEVGKLFYEDYIESDPVKQGIIYSKLDNLLLQIEDIKNRENNQDSNHINK